MRIARHDRIGILNASQRCEPSGFLFNKIITFLSANGYDVRFESFEDSEVVLINTCCVTGARMSEAKASIEEALQAKRVKSIIIFGCFADFARKTEVDTRVLTIGPREWEKFDQVFDHTISIERMGTGSLDHRIFIPYQSKITDRDHFVLISQGCAHRCSYCNITKVKGYVASRRSAEIIQDVREGARKGSNAFVLLGDDCGSYGVDIGTDLACLIKEIISHFSEIKLKISSFFPADFVRLYPDLRDIIAAGKIVYINIPVQSGSKRVLKLMNRNYEIDVLKRIIKEIKRLCPSVWLYTHVLANFPTETMLDYRRSLEAARLFDEFMVINYSDNPLTSASNIMPKVSKADQERRMQIAREVIKLKECGLVAEWRA